MAGGRGCGRPVEREGGVAEAESEREKRLASVVFVCDVRWPYFDFEW